MQVIRSRYYMASLQRIRDYIAEDNPQAADDLWLHIDEQVDKLADPNFPRRPGRLLGTWELVAHASYIVLLEQTTNEVAVLDVFHTAIQFP